MNLTPEELAMFPDLAPTAPSREPGEDDGDPTPAVDLEALKKAEAAVLPPDAPPVSASTPPPAPKRGRPAGSKNKPKGHQYTDAQIMELRAKNPDEAPWTPPAEAPKPAHAALIMPDCAACGAPLNPENSYGLGGKWTHLDCPKFVPPAATTPTTVIAAPEPVKPTPTVQHVPAAAEPDTAQIYYIPPQTLQIELGPETLAILKALLGK